LLVIFSTIAEGSDRSYISFDETPHPVRYLWA
jgi:hypothetical protein